MRRERFRVRKLHREGSAIVTVIVVVAFLCILSTMLLYAAGINYQIKYNNYLNKKNFYWSEVPFEEIRAQLMVDVSDVSRAAYQQMVMEYTSLDEDGRRDLYYRCFEEEFRKMMDAKAALVTDASYAGKYLGVLAGYTTLGPNMPLPADPPPKMVLSSNVGDDITIKDAAGVENEADGIIIIRGLNLVFTDENGRVSYLATDFKITAPEMSLDHTQSQTWDGSSDVDRERPETDISDCVIYINWEKN